MTGSQTTPPQLTDAAWKFIREHAENDFECDDPGVHSFNFDGDQGNWNWLFGEFFKLCVKVTP